MVQCAFRRIAVLITQRGSVTHAWNNTLTSFHQKYNMSSKSESPKTQNKSSDEESANSGSTGVPKSTDAGSTGVPKPTKYVRVRSSKSTDYEEMTREELVGKIKSLEAQTVHLKNIIMKTESGGKTCERNKGRKQRANRAFDFTKYNTRHVALQISYLGWNYYGLASSDHIPETIERYLFDALLATKLIESRATANYSRCGRTDKGVSARSQVIAMDLRTNLLEGIGVKVRENGTAHDRPGDKTKEVTYLAYLNRVLPPQIRVLAWCPVEQDFSARFSCLQRTYKYYFPEADLDIATMQRAAEDLCGSHDFRNLCKMDIKNGVTNFIRKILEAKIERVNSDVDGYGLCELTIVGTAFLWHQIRCIVVVLMLVGQRKEDPSIVKQLLDIEKHPRKPQYNMAADLPLVLFDAEYDNIQWKYDSSSYEIYLKGMQKLWTENAVKATIIRQMLDSFKARYHQSVNGTGESQENSQVHSRYQLCYVTGKTDRGYKRLLDRQLCEGLEERLNHFVKKRKLIEAPPKTNE